MVNLLKKKTEEDNEFLNVSNFLGSIKILPVKAVFSLSTFGFHFGYC